MRGFTLFLILLSAILVILFVLDNSSAVQVSFWFWNFESSLALVIFSSTTIGAFMMWMIGIPSYFRNRRSIADLRKENKQLQNRIDELTDDTEADEIPEDDPDEPI